VVDSSCGVAGQVHERPEPEPEPQSPDKSDPSSSLRPAYYAARPGVLRDWWTVLHPPYTAWNLAYVVIGACIAPAINTTILIATLLAFFGAVALAAHALDELHGRPLGTHIRAGTLFAVAVVGLAGAIALGIVGIVKIGWPIVPFLAVGPVLVIGYNYEIFGGVIHNSVGFAASWGAFPVLTAYVAQTGRMAWAPVMVAAAAFSLSVAQRALSTPARLLRRRTGQVHGEITLSDGGTIPVDSGVLLAPLELALRSTSWAIILFAAGLAVARLG